LIHRHVTGTTGTFGAAAAISKLLGLSAQQFFFAFGHATSLSAGTRSSFGSDTKTLHMGRGAQNGIVAAFLAEQDFDTGVNPIEYWGKLVSPTVDVKSLTADLGNRWELSENTFKPYPCGIVIHPLIDGGIRLREKGITSQQLVRLEVRVNPQCVRLCSIRHPSTQLEAVFSLYHGCAVGLLYGKEGRKEVSAEICNSKEVAAIRDKIEVTTDVRITDDSAQLKAILRDGSEVVESIEHAKGSLENPLTEKEIEVKFVDQAEEPLGLEKCQDIMTICWNLEKLADVSSLTKLCSTG
jgi:2-methylcitrate dehydratase PrpD